MTSVVASLGAVFSVGVVASGVRLAVPTALAAVGEVVSQRAGIFNLGLEGMMMVGAFTAFATTSSTGNATLGIVAGAGGGLAVALLMVLGTVVYETNMIVTGFALVLLGQGLANFLYDQGQNRLPTFAALGEVDTGPLARIAFFGRVLFQQNALLYLLPVLAALVALLLSRTRFGLEVDATGSDIAVARTKGVRVRVVRATAVATAGIFAGLGGAAITVGAVGNFGNNITAGKGFVAISIVAVARQRIGWTLLAAFLFGVLEAAQARLQDVRRIPVEFLPSLPWIALVVALFAFGVVRGWRVRRAI